MYSINMLSSRVELGYGKDWLNHRQRGSDPSALIPVMQQLGRMGSLYSHTEYVQLLSSCQFSLAG